jgi:hypothetical protein
MIGPTSTSGVTKLHRAAVNAHAIGQRAPMRVQSGIQRQQRRVDIDHAAVLAANEFGAEHAHEAGEHDEVRRSVIGSRTPARRSNASRVANARCSTVPRRDAMRRGDGKAAGASARFAITLCTMPCNVPASIAASNAGQV